MMLVRYAVAVTHPTIGTLFSSESLMSAIGFQFKPLDRNIIN